jgi:uncharacterized protein with HEPN domain
VKDDSVYLRHILEAISRIEENTSNGKVSFIGSHTLQDATFRNLQTMAEATQRLSDAAKALESGTDWRALSGFRNVLVHNYLGLDLEQIWVVTQRDVPNLKAAVERLLSGHEN